MSAVHAVVKRFGVRPVSLIGLFGFVGLLGFLAPPVCAQSWMRVTGIDTTRGVYSLAATGNAFFAATDSLIYRQTYHQTTGFSWQPTATQPVSGVPFYVLHARDSMLFAGTNGHGVYRSTNGGQTWAAFGSGLQQETILGLTSLGDSLYVGLGFSGVYVINLKAPTTWAAYTTGLTQFGTNWIGTAGGRLFAGMGAGLFVRERGGARWNEATWGDDLQRQAYEVVAVDTFLFAATDAGVFRARASDPLTWQAKDIMPMKGRDILALAVQGTRVYAGLNQSLQHWIWSSDDRGETWDVRAHEFAEIWDMRAEDNLIWAARQDGLWSYEFPPIAVNPGHRASAVRRGSAPDHILNPKRRLDGRRVQSPRYAPKALIPAPRD